MSASRVSDLVAVLEAEMPSAWAEPWDRVGLLAGDAEAPITGVLASLDPTPDALRRALELGASVLLTHHPAYLEGTRPFPEEGMAGVPFDAVARGVALVAAHTNLDRSPGGADALPLALGLQVVGPLESARQPVEMVVTYVPPSAADAVRAAMSAAGAGRIGRYEGCSFSSDGEGRYTPLPGSAPATGRSGRPETAAEVRIEAVCDQGAGERVSQAVRGAHPYEEPVIAFVPGTMARGVARMGRVCETPAPCTLADLAAAVGKSLGVRPTVWGDGSRRIERVATAPGSGRLLVAAARAAGADAIVTGELRYHEALDAAAAGLAVIEAGHDATEWPMVPVLAACARRTPGLAASSVHVDAARAHWWIAEGA